MAQRPDELDLPRDFGAYTLLKRLAVGGMAEVYVAKAQGIGGFEKLVAIKVIHPRLSEDEHFVQMLVEEAKLSVLLTHGNIAQTFDLGCIDETYCIVMEYVDGADTYRILKRAEARKKQLPIDICAYVMSEVANGLDYAHRKRDTSGRPLNVVHRDISPQNVLVSHTGEVKIVDFGIAKAALRTGQTEAGVIKGKYYYMSPEQAWGDPLDHRSDIFSVGVVLYELLTGQMLYREDNIPALLDKVRKADIAPPSVVRPEVPAELDEVVMKACAKQPEDRYQSAHDMAQELSTFLYTVSASFTAQRLAEMMAELFDTAPVSGERPAPAAKNEPRAATSELAAMRRVEFSPRVDSVIFDLDEEDGETRADLPPFRSGGPAAPSGSVGPTDADGTDTAQHRPVDEDEDEETLVHDAISDEEWNDAAAERAANTWDDPTTVEGDESVGRPVAAAIPRRRIPKPPTGAPRRPIPRVTPGARPSVKPPAPVVPFPPRPAPGAVSARPSVAPPPAPPPARPPAFPKGPPSPSGASAAPWPAPGPAPEHREAPVQPAPAWPSATPIGTSAPPSTAKGATSPSVAPEPPAVGDPFTARPEYNAPTQTLARQGPRWGLRIALGAAVGIAFLIAVILVAILASGDNAPPTALEVISAPPGATVTLDGRLLEGRTPLLIEEGLDPGRPQQLELSMDGYETERTEVRLVEGDRKQTILVLAPLRATLHVETVPAGAHVWIDDVLYGSAPISVPNLDIGREVVVRVSQYGRRTSEQSVRIVASDLEPHITVELADEEDQE